jgi:hypothetical protein
MTSFWLGLAAGTVLGVAICAAVIAGFMIWAWLAGRREGDEWGAPADW